MDPADIIHNAIVDMKLFHETLTPQDIFNNAKAVIKRLQMAGFAIVPKVKMAANTFTIEICDEDRRRIDALVEALKKSEWLSKLIEQRDSKLSVVVAHCEHPVVAHDIDDGATCSKCGRDLGWFCHISPKHYCEYKDDDEMCIHCGAPEERQ